MTPLEEINLDITNERNWFKSDKDILFGMLLALYNQGVITMEIFDLLNNKVSDLNTHFKVMEIQCHKLKDIINNKEQQ